MTQVTNICITNFRFVCHTKQRILYTVLSIWNWLRLCIINGRAAGAVQRLGAFEVNDTRSASSASWALQPLICKAVPFFTLSELRSNSFNRSHHCLQTCKTSYCKLQYSVCARIQCKKMLRNHEILRFKKNPQTFWRQIQQMVWNLKERHGKIHTAKIHGIIPQ